MTPANNGLIALGSLDQWNEGTSRGFDCNGVKVFAVRYGGKVYVYRNTCPHAAIPLEWTEHQFLDASGSMIQCANHGALFVIHTGLCVTGPCTGRSLEAIPHQIIDNKLWIAPL